MLLIVLALCVSRISRGCGCLLAATIFSYGQRAGHFRLSMFSIETLPRWSRFKRLCIRLRGPRFISKASLEDDRGRSLTQVDGKEGYYAEFKEVWFSMGVVVSIVPLSHLKLTGVGNHYDEFDHCHVVNSASQKGL
jgi:hypothetical protein